MFTKVISTPELLEQVLVQLPMRDLLVTAPLVSKSWHALTLSPTLQRALFFEPDPLASVSERVQNPLLMETFAPFFTFRQGKAWPGSLHAIDTMPWSKVPAAFKREEASWRRMLVTQPPVHTMTIEQRECHATGRAFVRQAVLKNLWLRMGALYDLTAPLIDNPRKRFCIRWRDSDPKPETDLMLEIYTWNGWMYVGNERVPSDGEKPIKIPFGGWRTEHMLDYDWRVLRDLASAYICAWV